MGGQIVLPHLHRRGVRGAGADTSRGRCCGRGERRRALRRGVLHRRDEVRAAQPLLGFESLVRPLRASLPRHVRDADAGDQLFEQLRALPIPGEAHPAVHQQYPPPKAAAGVRPRAERARLAVRGRPRAGHRRDLPQGQGRRHVQHRGLQRVEEHRPDTGHRTDGGQAAGQPRGVVGEAYHVRHRPRRPRSEVRHRLAQAQARTGMAAKPAVRRGDRKDRPLVPPKPKMDGRHNFWRIPRVLPEHV